MIDVLDGCQVVPTRDPGNLAFMKSDGKLTLSTSMDGRFANTVGSLERLNRHHILWSGIQKRLILLPVNGVLSYHPK
jgi:hypothetical protein